MSEQPLPGTIGRYRPSAVLGTGAMGTVYRAHDPVIDRDVAIKVVRTEAVEPELRAEFIDRLRREVQAAGRCNHANIVAVYDFSDEAAEPFIVMELVEGRTLQTLMRDPAERATLALPAMLAQILDALALAHGFGIIHRDIKPANILVTHAGVPKIADFGIARLGGSSMTMAGTMMGTPSYMAPEQVTDDAVDHRADLFGIGCILYEFYAGSPPFRGRNLSDTLLRLTGPASARMEPIVEAGADAFVPVLQQALAKPRAERFQSAAMFAQALRGRAVSSATSVTWAAPAPTSPAQTWATPATPTSPSPVPPPATRAQPVAPRDATALNLSVASQQTATSATLDPRWDPSLIARVEQALARHVGPMARVMVRQAARQAASAEDLAATLSRHLTTPADRTTFLRSVGERAEPSFDASSLTRGPTVTVAPPSAAPTRAGAGFTGVSQAALDAAQAALVVYVGPMARVMARKAASEAGSADDFIERLCAHVPKPDENTALRRRLRAEVAPKL